MTLPLAKTSYLPSDIRLWRIGRSLALMRTAGFVALVALALVGVFALGLFGLAHFENPSSHFETYEELKASGLIERGWVPEQLPRSATAIEESHDIDTNHGRASFKYKMTDTGGSGRRLPVASPDEGRAQVRVPTLWKTDSDTRAHGGWHRLCPHGCR